jgi:hypothetical protein
MFLFIAAGALYDAFIHKSLRIICRVVRDTHQGSMDKEVLYGEFTRVGMSLRNFLQTTKTKILH